MTDAPRLLTVEYLDHMLAAMPFAIPEDSGPQAREDFTAALRMARALAVFAERGLSLARDDSGEAHPGRLWWCATADGNGASGPDPVTAIESACGPREEA